MRSLLQYLKKKLYQSFIENHSAIIIMDPLTGKILEANKAALAFYGYDKVELLQINISDINTCSKEKIEIEIKNVSSNQKPFLNLFTN